MICRLVIHRTDHHEPVADFGDARHDFADPKTGGRTVDRAELAPNLSRSIRRGIESVDLTGRRRRDETKMTDLARGL